ncbi:MAG: TetR/AcrR family transcriptional regulator [Desulfobacteraceae bacterium]|nr:MAG: TetR/AcrR family transcriptional regulator [Desulfobacteraceae bacterium]
MNRSKETVSRIVQSALWLFVRKGYHATSIDEIMTRVGLTKGALYAHFRTKGELLFRIIDIYKVEFMKELMREVEKCEGSALDKMHLIISFNARFGVEHKDLISFLSSLNADLKADVDFEPALKKIYREYQQFLSKIIGQGIKQGEFKKDLNPDIAALIFIGTQDGIMHQWLLNRERVDGVLYIRTFRNLFMNGLLKN